MKNLRTLQIKITDDAGSESWRKYCKCQGSFSNDMQKQNQTKEEP
jgi:hypothetical protein